jgi:hypothetical protein
MKIWRSTPRLWLRGLPFFIAEFGWIGDSDVGLFLPGLVVKDDQFVPLLKPFPHFVWTTFIRRKVRVEKAVAILNKRLHRFYEDPELG